MDLHGYSQNQRQFIRGRRFGDVLCVQGKQVAKAKQEEERKNVQTCPYSTDCAGCVSYGDTLLAVEHVNLQYGDKVILRDVSVEVKDVNRRCHVQGQVVGFVGPSGCGKTSLFRIIAGLNKPTSGQVLVNSTRNPVHPGMVGVVAQNYTLFEHRTVLGNLELAASKKYHDRREAKAQSMALLARFGLADKSHLYPSQLSGGQRQRVAIIQQILCSSHFLLMDEPFAALDLIMLEKVCALINEVACLDELNTLILVTHDLTAAASVADHLWLMGRDRDANGEPIPGARIQENYNLVDLGLCWQENITTRPDFVDFVRQVKERFRTL
jgi:ABC-type nitrate/sulfonate/bicarbonate transport system ATPase subunit